MIARVLKEEELTVIYRKFLVEDFPRAEVKSLNDILNLFEKGEYIGVGFFYEELLFAYAFFYQPLLRKTMLLDYFAVRKGKRGMGIGKECLVRMKKLFSKMDGIYLEVENAVKAGTSETYNERVRRNLFYLENGILPTDIESKVYGVDFSILYLPICSDICSKEDFEYLYGRLFGGRIPYIVRDNPKNGIRKQLYRRGNIIYRRALKEDVEAVYELMMEVYDGLAEKSCFVPEEKENLYDYVDKGMIFLACDGDKRLAGYFLVIYPGAGAENLAADLGFSAAKQKKTAHMESCCVREEYRGSGMEKDFLRIAEQCIDGKKYKYLMGTVSPSNAASVKSFEDCGYQVVRTQEKYGGLLRHIMMKEKDA